MSPGELEDQITARAGDVLRFQAHADRTVNASEKAAWREEARRAAKSVAWLVSLRTPETVKQMEAERGLT